MQEQEKALLRLVNADNKEFLEILKEEKGELYCSNCGMQNISVYEYSIKYSLDICNRCACDIANAFVHTSSGNWLTKENTVSKGNGKRKSVIPHRLRKQVLERDKYRCKYCETHIDLTIDHIYPESKGGETKLENLQTLCRTCNCSKGAKVNED